MKLKREIVRQVLETVEQLKPNIGVEYHSNDDSTQEAQEKYYHACLLARDGYLVIIDEIPNRIFISDPTMAGHHLLDELRTAELEANSPRQPVGFHSS